MNKEVIYLEPEDDITDILTKLQQAEQKLVALVPPKKASILRSAVNMKLVARVAKECDKVTVIVTADPAIIKMAMLAKIPVAKTLQSRPIVPTEENVKAAESKEEIIDEELENDPKKSKNDKNSKVSSKASKMPSTADFVESADTFDLSEETLENGSKEAEKAKAKKEKAKKAAALAKDGNFFQKYRKWIIIGSCAVVLLAVVLVWALVFAPAVTITVAVSSTPNNFSENIRFTTDENAQNLDENLLYVEQIDTKIPFKADVTGTGKEDRGDRAEGRITASYSFEVGECLEGCRFTLPEGAIIVGKDSRNNEYEYIIQDTQVIEWTSKAVNTTCEGGTLQTIPVPTCTLSASTRVIAAKAGTEYNLSANSRWEAYGGAKISNVNAISGGTTDIVETISDDDINKVKDAKLAEYTLDGKEDLLTDLGSNVIPIEASFKGEAKVTEVKYKDGRENPDHLADDESEIIGEATYSVYVLSRTTVDEYIKVKMQLPEDQKIYSTGEPYVERFTDIENEARLKSTVDTGPTVTEADILDKVKGKKTGEVASILRSINGVSSVNIQTSFFWVWSVPNDESKVTIKLTGEDNA